MGIACDLSVLVRYPGGNNVLLFSFNCSVEGCRVDFYHSVSGMFSLKHVLSEATFNQQRTRFRTPFFYLCKSIFSSCMSIHQCGSCCFEIGISVGLDFVHHLLFRKRHNISEIGCVPFTIEGWEALGEWGLIERAVLSCWT